MLPSALSPCFAKATRLIKIYVDVNYTLASQFLTYMLRIFQSQVPIKFNGIVSLPHIIMKYRISVTLFGMNTILGQQFFAENKLHVHIIVNVILISDSMPVN